MFSHPPLNSVSHFCLFLILYVSNLPFKFCNLSHLFILSFFLRNALKPDIFELLYEPFTCLYRSVFKIGSKPSSLKSASKVYAFLAHLSLNLSPVLFLFLNYSLQTSVKMSFFLQRCPLNIFNTVQLIYCWYNNLYISSSLSTVCFTS